MDFKAILRTFLKIILPLAFGCLLLWYLYSKMDIGEIWNVIRKGVRYEIIHFFPFCLAWEPILSGDCVGDC